MSRIKSSAAALLFAAVVAAQPPEHRVFPTADAAARALIDAVKASNLDEVLAIFGPDGQELIASSDPATARRHREVFNVAVAEEWHLADQDANHKTLVIGNEDWPFPVPIVKDSAGWRFDTAAGKEEIVARRVGRNELEAIETVRAYVGAQQRYAQNGHDGKPAGLYATRFGSEPGKENGLYWPTARGQKPSPLGDLVAQAALEGRHLGSGAPEPLHGYYFKILTSQGADAPGGAKPYVMNGEMSKGFALVAWPAQYNVTGVMTFIVNVDGVVYQKDLKADTDKIARSMLSYNPDASWHKVQ
jgi:Protein of unknown function (DUF2950)